LKITRSAISLNVDDVEGSARFALEHLGFVQEMADDGFVSLTRDDAGFNLIFLRTGLETFKPQRIAGSAGMGTLIVFVVEDIDAQYERLRAEGANIVTPIETEPWGERFFQMEDPSGIVYQLVQWIG
jgi:catechol 2,3-dioxygenase-like lactoylglutathione lyase family enzyme